MLAFSAKTRRTQEAQGRLTKIINNNCPTMEALSQGEREERRLNLTIPVYVVPMQGDRVDIESAKATVTKEFSGGGFSVILDEALGVEEVVVVIAWENATTYFRGDVKHQSPIGAGLWQCGVQVKEILPSGEYLELGVLEI